MTRGERAPREGPRSRGKGKGYYMISTVAQTYGIHPQTLRLYEREGLLKPSRTEGNTRLYSEEDLRHYAEAFRRPGVHRASLAYYRSLWASRRIGRREWDKKITCPTLVIWGDKDPALPFDLTRGMERDIPGVRIERVRNCGHFVQEERAEEVNRLLLEFL